VSTTAFALGLDLMSAFEDQGQGITTATASTVYNNFQFSTCLVLMAFDTALYYALGWYLDQVMPTWIRDFGIPRPWYFPVTPSYWREVFGVPAPRAPKHSDGAPLVDQLEEGIRQPVVTNPVRNGGHASAYFEAPDSSLRAKAACGPVRRRARPAEGVCDA
jgi:hypothetical protein